MSNHADDNQLPSTSALAPPLDPLFPTAGEDSHYLTDHGGDDSSHIIIDPTLLDEDRHHHHSHNNQRSAQLAQAELQLQFQQDEGGAHIDNDEDVDEEEERHDEEKDRDVDLFDVQGDVDAEAEGERESVGQDADLDVEQGQVDLKNSAAAAAALANTLEQRIQSDKFDLQSGLQVTKLALKIENARLRKMIEALEKETGSVMTVGELAHYNHQSNTTSPVIEASKGDQAGKERKEINTAVEMDDTLDELREFAHAVNRSNLDLLEAQVNAVDWSNVGGQVAVGTVSVEAGSEAQSVGIEGTDSDKVIVCEQNERLESAATAADFIHGLVTSITLTKPSSILIKPCDPNLIASSLIREEIENTMRSIVESTVELASFTTETMISTDPATENLESKMDEQNAQAASALDSAKVKVMVLRDMVARLQKDIDEVKEQIERLKKELNQLIDEDQVGIKVERELEVKNVMLMVRSNVESMLRQLKERGQLPHTPLSLLSNPLLTSPISSPQPTPANPRKRGRPPRSTAPRTSLVPSHLTHLVPEEEVVKQREQDTPIRRKGVKRSRSELERERKREEEEEGMFRSLVGIGVGLGNPGATGSSGVARSEVSVGESV